MLQIILPMLLMLVGLLVIVYLFIRHERQSREEAYREKSLTTILPNRMQAYERLTLYIERIRPENMVAREQKNARTAMELHTALVNCIRQEFEHNLAMQIYISSASWSRIVRAKDEVLKCINTVAKETNPKVSSMEYGRKIIEAAVNDCKFYVERALEGMRRDVAGEFIDK